MEVHEAKKILEGSVRHEARDHAFGDCEVIWEKDGREIAGGYFGGDTRSVWINDPGTNPSDAGSFQGDDANELRKVGKLETSRNDSTGPDEYHEGETMPALTLEGVRQELTEGGVFHNVFEEDNRQP